MSSPTAKNLGILKPAGGGDPIPLLKEEILIGRRSSCDISLDFENISSRHCTLKFINGVWHVRDMRSTNGTFVNRQRIENDHAVLPDDELKLASHVYSIDYEPTGHVGIASTNQALEEGMAEASRSLLELAGIEVEPDERRPPRHHRNGAPASSSTRAAAAHAQEDRARKAAAGSPQPQSAHKHGSDPDAAFHDPLDLDLDDDDRPGRAERRPLPNDDEFFDMIQGDLK